MSYYGTSENFTETSVESLYLSTNIIYFYLCLMFYRSYHLLSPKKIIHIFLLSKIYPHTNVYTGFYNCQGCRTKQKRIDIKIKIGFYLYLINYYFYYSLLHG